MEAVDETMLITIHQPEHLPWLGFLNKADQADLLVLLDVVQYRKDYFQHRNRILTHEGVAWLTVPVLMKGYMERTIREMRINPQDQKWRTAHRKLIFFNYKKHPYFDTYYPFLEATYKREWEFLADLNEHFIRWMFEVLGIATPVVRASELGVEGSSSQLLRDICLATGARTYLSGPFGRDYLDESLFAAHDIEVRYHAFNHPTYPQRGSDAFVPGLSALDLLFNCGGASLEVIREGSRGAD